MIFLGIFLFFDQVLYGIDPLVTCISWAICLYILYYGYSKLFSFKFGFSPFDFTFVKEPVPNWLKGKQCIYFYIIYGLVMSLYVGAYSFSSSVIETIVFVMVPLVIMNYADKSKKNGN